MIQQEDLNIGQTIGQTIRHTAGDRIRQVILYGSRVGGVARQDSDFDLLVVEADPVAKGQEQRRLAQAVQGLPHAVDVRVMGEREFEETKKVIGGLAYVAHKYGLVLHAHP